MALAPRLSSGSAIEPVAARPDALEVGPRSTSAGRKAAIDRIPRDGISEEPFDRRVGLPHVHRATSLRQNVDHGPLDHPVAETTPPRSLARRSVGPDPRRNTAQKCIENAPRNGLSSVHLGALTPEHGCRTQTLAGRDERAESIRAPTQG